MNKKDNRPKPKKHHSKDKSNSVNYLPATIAKLEAYSKQNKRSLGEEDEFYKNEIRQQPTLHNR